MSARNRHIGFGVSALCLFAAAAAAQGPGPVGAMAEARYLFEATALPDGRALITGGFGPQGECRAAEIYDRATRAFTVVPGFTARVYHTATLLGDGTVLIAGGLDCESWQTTDRAQIFRPAQGTFGDAAVLRTPRAAHTATVLKDGRILIAGGVHIGPDGAELLAAAELFDPAAGAFSTVGALGTARYVHGAARLDDGRVLVAGGSDGLGAPLASAELFDPVTGTFSAAGSMNAARLYLTLDTLAGGTVLATGGMGEEGVLASTEAFDARTNSFSPGPPTWTARAGHRAVVLQNGTLLLTGGAGAEASRTTEWYDPAAAAFRRLEDLSSPRYFHAAARLADGSVLVAGGSSDDGVTTAAEIFEWVAPPW